MCPYLNFINKQGNIKVMKVQVIKARSYRLKTGGQWRKFHRESFFTHHIIGKVCIIIFKRWSDDGSSGQNDMKKETKEKLPADRNVSTE